MSNKSQISYTSVVINNVKDISNLQSLLYSIGGIPNGWKSPQDYHMTITLGELPLGLKMRGDIGSEVDLTVNKIGISDNAIAAGVTGYISKKSHQHITLAFKEFPKDSDDIVNWKKLEQPFIVTGIITEQPSVLEEIRKVVRKMIEEF